MSLAVVIIGIGDWEKYTKPCIESIKQHEPDVHIFLLDNNSDPAYLFEEGLYFVKRNRFHEAIANDLKVVDLLTGQPARISFEPGNTAENRDRLLPLAYYQLGYLYGLTGRYEQSIRYSREAVAHNPDLREAYINLISAYRSSGQQREADSVASVYRSRWPGQPLP